VLTDNNLAGKELSHLGSLTQIETLKLGGNKIKTLDELKSLVSQSQYLPLKSGLTNLRNLDLVNNDVTNLQGYQTKIYEMFPNLDVSYLSNQL